MINPKEYENFQVNDSLYRYSKIDDQLYDIKQVGLNGGPLGNTGTGGKLAPNINNGVWVFADCNLIESDQPEFIQRFTDRMKKISEKV